jgi:glucose dehydrogenase
LISVDAATGKSEWEVLTVDTTKPYTITGAPRIVEDKVIIGNGGAELGVRGYVTAYDASSGKQVWRFYTVPGDPEVSFESEAMEMAAKTWTGQWWQYGGGGTVWDAMAYDPQLKLLYIGNGQWFALEQAAQKPGRVAITYFFHPLLQLTLITETWFGIIKLRRAIPGIIRLHNT